MSRTLRVILSFAVSFALIAAVLSLTDGRAVLSRLAGAEPAWLLVSAVCLTAQTVLMALRWRLTAARLDLTIGRRVAIGEYYLAQLVNMTLPGGVIGDIARAARTRRVAGLTRAAQAIMIERLAGQMSIFVLAVLGFGTALMWPGGIVWPGSAPLVLGATICVTAAGVLVYSKIREPDNPGAIASFARATHRALLARDILPLQAAFGLGIVALNIAAFAAAARATGTPLGFEACVTLIPLILSAMLIPFAVGGWGWREGAAAALFPLAGAGPDAGVAAGVAFGAVLLCASLPGVLWPLVSPRAVAMAALPESPPRPTSRAYKSSDQPKAHS